MDRLSAMKAFVQVVEQRSFSAAGQRLGISSSRISKSVARLEDWLGVHLLLRTTRSVNLTEAGKAFYERCCRILSEVQDAESAATGLESAPSGVLRINAPSTFGTQHLTPLLPEFLARFPLLSVDLYLDERVVDPVQGGFDVTIRASTSLRDSSFVVSKLGPVRIVVCASPEYLQLRGTPQTPQELVQHSCLTANHLTSPNVWRFGPRGEISVLVSGVLRANSGTALRDAAIAGLGLVQMPTFIVGDALREGTLRTVLESCEGPVGALCALYHPGQTPPKVRAFVDFLGQRFSQRRIADRTACAELDTEA